MHGDCLELMQQNNLTKHRKHGMYLTALEGQGGSYERAQSKF